MLAQLKNRLLSIGQVCSVEIQLEASGDMRFNWVLLSKQKHALIIEKSGTCTGDLKTLTTFVAPSVPLLLVLSGKGVLHKKVEQQGGEVGKLFDYIFPNARISDYVMQTVLCKDNSFQVSVARKEQVDKLVAELTDWGYAVLSFSLGPFAVLSLYELLAIEEKEVQLARHKLKIDAYTPMQYSYDANYSSAQEHLVQLSNEQIADYLVVPYASAFLFLIGAEHVEVSYDTIQKIKETYQDKQVYKLLTWGSLIFFFSLLLINTGFYTAFTSTNNELSARYNSVQHESISTQKNADDFNSKESFLEKSGWLDASLMSFYADRIAASLPQEIQLTSMEVCPLNIAGTRKEKKEVFDKDVLEVQGIAVKPTDVNKWTKRLAEYTWIEQVKVHNYTFDHKTGTGSFTLHLKTTGELD